MNEDKQSRTLTTGSDFNWINWERNRRENSFEQFSSFSKIFSTNWTNNWRDFQSIDWQNKRIESSTKICNDWKEFSSKYFPNDDDNFKSTIEN